MMIPGLLINYYFICKRKVWFFSKDLNMEQTSDLVALGQLLHEIAYRNETKNLLLDNVNFDFIRKGDRIIVSEIKKSKKLESAGKWQLLYYLYFLKQKSLKAEGLIRYPKLRKVEKVKLSEEKEKKIREILMEIKKITKMSRPPPPIRKPYCKSCSYYELCFS